MGTWWLFWWLCSFFRNFDDFFWHCWGNLWRCIEGGRARLWLMGVSPIQHRAVIGSYDFNRLLPPIYNKFCILYWASIQAIQSLSEVIDLLKLKTMFFVNFLLINCIFTMRDLMSFSILGYLGWFWRVFGAFFDQNTCSFDAVLIILLFDAISVGSNSILKWAKIWCHIHNLSIWKFFINKMNFINFEHLHELQ